LGDFVNLVSTSYIHVVKICKIESNDRRFSRMFFFLSSETGIVQIGQELAVAKSTHSLSLVPVYLEWLLSHPDLLIQTASQLVD
jgi:hypothetical protein